MSKKILLLLSFALFANAEEPTLRSVTLEWESVLGASGYELEITNVDKKSDSKKTTKITKEPKWKDKIPMGKYTYRIRSVDDRGAYGDWSIASNLDVRLPWPKPIEPSEGFSLDPKHRDKEKVKFTWTAVPLADRYYFELRDENQKIVKQGATKKTAFEVALPVGKSYSWTIASLDKGESKLQLETLNQSFQIKQADERAPAQEQTETKVASNKGFLQSQKMGFGVGSVRTGFQELYQDTYNSSSVSGTNIYIKDSMPIQFWNSQLAFKWDAYMYNASGVYINDNFVTLSLQKSLATDHSKYFGLGLFVKEVPFIVSNNTFNQFYILSARTLGPILSFGINGRFSQTLSWSAEAAIFFDLVKLRTPNNGDIDGSYGASLNSKLYFATVSDDPIYLAFDVNYNQVRYSNQTTDVDINTGNTMRSGSFSYAKETMLGLSLGADLNF